jgi:hypothetical protein
MPERADQLEERAPIHLRAEFNVARCFFSSE